MHETVRRRAGKQASQRRTPRRADDEQSRVLLFGGFVQRPRRARASQLAIGDRRLIGLELALELLQGSRRFLGKILLHLSGPPPTDPACADATDD